MSGLRRDLGAGDQHRLDLYTTNIRELEQRIQRIEAQNMSEDRSVNPRSSGGSS